ncbi:MAG: hypothetical protein IJM55_04450 [Ruminococcus sp.]|nr:hypothetical protein [Ruminococcus sp.]
MKKRQLAKRVSAISMAAALSVSAVAWDYYPLSGRSVKTVSFAESEDVSESTEDVAEKEVAKSAYPMFFGLTIESGGENGFIINAENFSAVSDIFDITLVLPAEEEESEKRVRMSDEGFDLSEGKYTIEITAKGDDNPYDLSSFTDGKLTLTVDTANMNASRFDYSEGEEYFYYTGSGNIISPLDYDTIYVSGRDDEDHLLVESPYGKAAFDENDFEMNMGLVIAAELRQGTVPESDNYSVERFTDNEDVPYFYGENIFIKPTGARVFLADGDGETTDIAPEGDVVEVGDEAVESEEYTYVFADAYSMKTLEDDLIVEKVVKGVNGDFDGLRATLNPESTVAANKAYDIILNKSAKYNEETGKWTLDYDTTRSPQAHNDCLEVSYQKLAEYIPSDSTTLLFLLRAKPGSEFDITDDIINDATCGTARVVDGSEEGIKYIKVTPNAGYNVNTTSEKCGVYYKTKESSEGTETKLVYDSAKTEAANDGSLYFELDTRLIHNEIDIYVNYQKEIQIDLRDLATDGALADNICSVSVSRFDAEGNIIGRGTVLEDDNVNSFVVRSDIVNVDSGWRIDKILFNNKDITDADSPVNVTKNEDTSKSFEYVRTESDEAYLVTIYCTMAELEHTVTYTGNGKVDASFNNKTEIDSGIKGSVKYNENMQFTATPDVGWYVKSITKNGSSENLVTAGAEIDSTTGAVKISAENVKEDNVVYNVEFAEAVKADATEADIDARSSVLPALAEKDDKYYVSVLMDGYSYSFDNTKRYFKGGQGDAYAFDGNSTIDYEVAEGSRQDIVYALDPASAIVYAYEMDVEFVEPDFAVENFEITENKSTLRFLTFGIFGNDTMTFQFKAVDNNKHCAVPAEYLYVKMPDEITSVGDGKYTVDEILSDDFNIVVGIDKVEGKEFNKTFIADPDEREIAAYAGADVSIIEKPEGRNIALYIEKTVPKVFINAVAPENVSGFRAETVEAKGGKADMYWTNGSYRVQVEGNDAPNGEENFSGINTLTLNGDDRAIDDKTQKSTGWTYTDNEVHTASGSYTAAAEDNSGNKAEKITKVINVDTESPELQVMYNGRPVQESMVNGTLYSSSTVELLLTGKDSGSGVYEVKDEQGTALNYEEPGKTNETDGTFLKYRSEETNGSNGMCSSKTYGLVIEPNNSRSYSFTAYDYVGNKSKQEQNVNVRVITDNIAPTVDGFVFNSANQANTNPAVSMDYGYWFNAETVVTVNTSDKNTVGAEPSGVKALYYSLVNYDALPDTVNGERPPVDDGLIEAYMSSEPIYGSQFTVPANWKGQIFVKAVDNAGNSSGWHTPDGLVIETRSQHDAEEHINITMPSTSYKDANGNPLYGNSVTIPVTISDFSGIQQIDWYIIDETGERKDSTVTFNGATPSDTAWQVTGRDKNLATAVRYDLNVSSNSSNIRIGYKMTCRSGHSTPADGSYVERVFSIDTQAPAVQLSLSGSAINSNGKKYYNQNRKVDIVVSDRNFDASSATVEVKLTNALGGMAGDKVYNNLNWTFDSSTASNIDGEGRNLWRASITLDTDADYSGINVSVKDALGHSGTASAGEGFTIDTTRPVLTGSFDNDSAQNGNYYNASRKAVIKINEHNFIPADAVVSIKSYGADNITEVDSVVVKADSWKQSQVNKDEWTAEIPFTKDGRYNFTVDYTDPARNRGNSFASGEFFIDMTAPTVDQTFTEKNSSTRATNGTLEPMVRFSDYNLPEETRIGTLCTVEIKKTELDGTTVNKTSVTSKSYKAAADGSPAQYETWYDIFADNVDTDGIYHVKITAQDKAGNTSEPLDLTVSVNRYGSTYEIVNSDAVNAVKKYKNGIPVNENTEVVIREINATSLTGDRKVTVVKNGSETKELGSGDFKIEENRVAGNEEGENGWYEFIYTISKDNFDSDGSYLINIESSDEAGNSNSNNTPVYAERKCAVEFAVDKTAPEVIIAGVDDGAVLKESDVQLRITCSDQNLKNISDLVDGDLTLVINGKDNSVDALKGLGAAITNDEAGNIIIELPVKSDGKKSEEKITVLVKDKAGNTSDSGKSTVEFTLSASFWDLHKGPVIGLGAAGLLGILALIVLMIKKRRNS